MSPTSTTGPTAGGVSASSSGYGPALNDRRLSDLANYRRDLSVLESSRGQQPSNQQKAQPQPQHFPYHSQSLGNLGGDTSQIAPWMSSSLSSAPSSKGPSTSFYHDSDDSMSIASQFSPGFSTSGGRPGTGAGANETSNPSAPHLIAGNFSFDSDVIYHGLDGRRPSAASVVTTASSQGSRTSGNRGGLRKLQGFFGEEFPGRDGSETSLPNSLPTRDQRSRSYSHTRPSQRDRNYSNATDREQSPASSRPRTPVPAPEVVPFLYQDNSVGRYLLHPPISAPVPSFFTCTCHIRSSPI